MHRTRTVARRAFTLVELLAVILITAVLVTITIVVVQNANARAQTAAALANLKQVTTATLTDASLEQKDEVSRTDVVTAMEASGASVTDGLSANAWHLGTANDSPTVTHDFAVGFAVGTQDPQDDAGDRAALVVAGGGGDLLGQIIELSTGTATGVGNLPEGTTPADLLGNGDLIEPGEGSSQAGPPRDVAAAPGVNPGSLLVSWTEPEGAVSYTVIASSGGEQYTCTSTTPLCLLIDLPQGAQYEIVVTAHYADARAFPAAPITTTLAPPAPAQPVIDLDESTGAWTATWDEVAGATGYDVEHVVTGEQTITESLETTTVAGQLAPGATLTVRVRATAADTQSSWSPDATITRPLTAPAAPDLTLDIATGTWTATWGAVENATSYVVESSSGATPNEDPTDLTTATGTVDPGQSITVRVRALSETATSAWSAPATRTRNAATPQVPTLDLNDTTGEWTATWAAAAGATGYVAEHRIAAGAWTPTSTTGTTLSGTVPNGTTVTVRVKATAGTTQSDYSGQVSATRAPAAPAAPALSIDDATGAWTATWAATSGATGYVLEHQVNGSPWTATPTTELTTTGTIGEGQSISVRVKATAAAKSSAFSAATTVSRGPAAPTTPALTLNDTTGAWTATWPAAPGAASYVAEIQLDTGEWTPQSTTSTSVTGTAAWGQTVNVRVHAVAGSKTSATSAAATATRIPATPRVPTLTLDDATGEWRASWPTPAGATGFIVEYQVGTGTWVATAQTARFAVGTIANGQTINVRLKGTVGDRQSGYSPVASMTRTPAVPATPTLTVDDAAGTWSATWPAATGATGYIAESKIGTGTWVPTTQSARTLSGTLAHGETITVRVKATVGSTQSAYSAEAAANRAPAVPATPVLSTNEGTGAWTATWPAAAGATGYSAEYRYGTGAWTATQTTALQLTGSTAEGQALSVRVKAQSPSRDSAYSAEATWTRAPRTPATPTVSFSGATWTATWTASTGATGYVAEYRLGGGAWVPAATTTRTLTGSAAQGQTVDVRVKATAGSVESAYSPTASATRAPATPARPQVVIDDNRGTWTATWSASTGATSYIPTYTTTSGASFTGQPQTERTFSGEIAPGDTLQFGVRAAAGTAVSPVSVYHEQTRTPSIVETPTTTIDSSTGQWTATWPAAEGATSYLVEFALADGAWTSLPMTPNLTVTASGAPYDRVLFVRVTSMTPGMRDVRPTDVYALAPSTPSMTFRDLKPVTVTSSFVSGSTARFTWPAAAGATHYNVGLSCNAGAVTWTTITTRTADQACVEGDLVKATVIPTITADGGSGWLHVTEAPAATASYSLPVGAATGGVVAKSTYQARVTGICAAGVGNESQSRSKAATVTTWSDWTQAKVNTLANSTIWHYAQVARNVDGDLEVNVRCRNATTGKTGAVTKYTASGLRWTTVGNGPPKNVDPPGTVLQ